MKILEEKLEEQKKLLEKTWDKILSDKEIYNRADKLLTEKNQDKIISLLGEYSEDYKDIGSLLGTNFAEALQEKVQQACDALKNMMDTTVSDITGNSINSGSSSSSSSGSNKKEYVWVEDGANTELFTDSTGTKSKGSLWSNGIASADKLVKGSYSNGFYEIFDQNGKSLGWVDRYKINKWNDISAFASGGRTPSNIGKDGALSILHASETILNANDTKKLDNIYDFVTVSASLLDRLEGYVDLSNKIQEATMPSPDYNRILGGDTTTNNNNSREITMNNEINITNNTKSDSYFNARSLEKMFKSQISKYGG